MDVIKSSWEYFLNYFSHGYGYKLIKIYKSIRSKIGYLALYGVLIVFLIQESIAFIFGEKLLQLSDDLIIEYKLEGHSKFWIEKIGELLNSSNLYIFIGAFVVLCILFVLNFLDKIFPDKKQNQSIANKINFQSNIETLCSSIKRDIEDEIYNSILDNAITLIEGEEGVGKTILSLQIVEKLSKSDYIIRFFNSSEWEDLKRVEDLLYKENTNNFDDLVLSEPKKIIIFLDGINEKNALQASVKILENYQRQTVEVRDKIQLVFTTRDLSSYSGYEQSLWSMCKKFKLKKFTEDELQKAIKKIDPEYVFDNFPNELKSVASIPRYLNLAFRLKVRLGSYENISKEILYWEGLKEQIKTDPKIREQGFTEDSDIEDILYELCQTVTIDGNTVMIDKVSFKAHFGDDYRKIKTPFLENRMVSVSNSRAIELNFDMVVVAYSIYLRTLFEDIHTSLTVEEIADFFKEKLEPYDNDNMSSVPFIVFQLSLEKDNTLTKEALSKIYAGLLYLWLDNHNSNIHFENLDFWSKKDFESYVYVLDIVEFEHKNFTRPKLKNGMLEVLSNRWSRSGANDEKIQLYLEDVLSINLSSNIDDRKKLIRRAIRIIFSYPVEYFLDKFLEMYEVLATIDTTENLLFQDSLDKYLSILLRFGYKEDVFTYLLDNRQYDEFLTLFRSHELSEKMGIQIENNNRLILPEKIEAKEELLKDFTVENVSKFHDLSFFSHRRDLELSDKDKATIKTTLSILSSSYRPSEFMGGGRDDNVDIDFLMILASFDEDAFNSTNQIFLYEAISQKARLSDIEKFDLCMFQNDKVVAFIIDNLDSLIDIEDKKERDSYIDKLIEIILFSADEEKMLEFFDLIIDQSCSVCLSKDTAEYMKPIGGEGLLSLVHNKIEVYHSKKINDPKVYENYMTYLFMLEDYKNTFLRDWIIRISSNIEEKSKLNEFQARVFVTVLPAVQYFDRFNVREFLPDTGNYILWWISKEEGFLNESTFDELTKVLPIESIGELLYKNKRYDDITKWGMALFENKNAMSSIQYLGLKKPLEVFAENNKELFLDYAVTYLSQVTDIGILFTGGFKDELIELLMKFDFEKAMELYESDNRKSLNSQIIHSLFNVEMFGDNKHIKYREEFILNAKSDLEYLQIAIMAFQGKTDNEVLKICKELLESRYAKDRLKAISMIMWFATPNEIEIINNLKLYDDSDYVRKYAQWAEQVSFQEKYTREICEEAFYEKDKSALSAKLYQIRNALTPTFGYWGGEIIEKCRESNKSELDKVYIQKFLHRTKEKRKMTDKFEISGRKLSEYYCGEKLDRNFKYILGMD